MSSVGSGDKARTYLLLCLLLVGAISLSRQPVNKTLRPFVLYYIVQD